MKYLYLTLCNTFNVREEVVVICKFKLHILVNDELIKALNERIQNIHDSLHIEIALISYKVLQKLTLTRLHPQMTSPTVSTPISGAPTPQGITHQHSGSQRPIGMGLVTIAITLA